MSDVLTPDYQRGPVTLYLGDCLDVLPHLTGIDAVVTDPPYGIGADRRQRGRAGRQPGAAAATSRDYGATDWDLRRPPVEAFNEMLRVAPEQVIFGGNYFADMLPPSASWLVWDKDNGANGYADFELAWTSHRSAARKVRWRWHGMLQEPGHPRDGRVHPTQKPVGLFRWVLDHYTSDGALVLDPYMGSGTTGVACAQAGRRFIGVEIEPKYFDIAVSRIDAELRQGRFDFGDTNAG